MSAAMPPWATVLVSVLLVASGVGALVAALGMLRLPDFFLRMHPSALASTLCTWCVALASIVQVSLDDARLDLRAWLIVVLLSITVPITTTLLARAALFRQRQANGPVPPPLQPRR